MLHTLTRQTSLRPAWGLTRHLSSKPIPFDTEPFPFKRFEPCCPDPHPKGRSNHFENGYVPCLKHPMPNVIGGKIDMVDDFHKDGIARHLMVCVGSGGDEWHKSKVEAVQGGLVSAIDSAKNTWLKEHRDLATNQQSEFTTTVCDRPSSSPWPTADVILFPDFRRYTAVDPTKDLVSGAPFHRVLSTLWRSADTHDLPDVAYDNMQGINTVILVCTHTMRDKRCGVLGPLIVEEFRKHLHEQGLWHPDGPSSVEVWGTSHVGGHKFSGNVIIHQRGLGGHMYGNVRQCHVPSIVDRHIKHGKIIRELWRGVYSM